MHHNVPAVCFRAVNSTLSPTRVSIHRLKYTACCGVGFLIFNFQIMSVQKEIQRDWAYARQKAIPKHFADYSNMVRIAIDCNGNEYHIEKETDKTYLVTHPEGIRAYVWKSGFRTMWVDKERQLKKLRWCFQ